jgi:hypothetical protein
MKEGLITFETAQLAKEKGFDWEVDNGYNNDSQLLCNDRQRELEFNYNEEEGRTSAPTQSLLQKWLREHYKIHIEVIPDESDPADLWHTIVYPLYCMKEPSNEGSFKTYEEALEKGLVEALKLIQV